MRILSFKWFLLILPIFLSASACPTFAQSLGLGLGWYESIDPPKPTWSSNYNIDQKPTFSIEIYFRNIVNSKRNTRLGFQLSFTRARSNPKNPDEWSSTSYEYLFSSYLFSYQRKIYHKDFFYLLGSFSGGLSFRKSDPVDGHGCCEVPFANIKEGISLQPGVYCVFRVYKVVAIQISGRYNYLITGGDEFYPFSSGFLFEAGLLLVPIGSH